MLIIKILKPCLFPRSTNYLMQRIVTFHATQFKKIHDKPKIVTSGVSSEMLLTELNSSFPSKILLSLENNRHILNGSHIVTALTRFLKLYMNKKSQTTNEDMNTWSEQEFFKQLSSIVNLNIDKLNGSEAVEILDIFNKMEVPFTLNIIESLVKHVKVNINDLSLVDICTFSDILRKMSKKSSNIYSQSDLLHHLLVKMSMEFDENNINHIERGLNFASTNFSYGKLQELFIDYLKNYRGKVPVRTAILLFQSLCNCDTKLKNWYDGYKQIQDKITENIDILNKDQVCFILLLLSDKLKMLRDERFYNAEFIDLLVHNIIDNDMGLETALSALKNINFMRHESRELLNYCSASYFEKTVLSEQKIVDEAGKLLVLIHGLALARHNTVFWDQIENFIENKKQFLLKNYDYDTLCILAMNLLCLNYYPTFILEKLFDGNFDYSNQRYMQWTFCKIYQILKSDPKYNGPMPKQAQIESLKNLLCETWRKDRKSFGLTNYLEKGLGGSQYIRKNIVSKSFHIIDFVAVFDNMGNPIPLDSANNIEKQRMEYIEDLEIPPNCKIVCIVHMPFFWFWRNTENLLGLYSIIVKTLENMSYKVIPINQSVWDKIPEDKKVDFLMKEIQLRLDRQ